MIEDELERSDGEGKSPSGEKHSEARHAIVSGHGLSTPAPPAFSSSPQNLLPHYPSLVSQLLEPLSSDDQWDARRARLWELEMLPYSLKGARLAVHNFVRIQQEVVEETLPADWAESERNIRYGISSSMPGFYVDSFLEVVVRAQNAITRVLDADVGKGHHFPSSLRRTLERDEHRTLIKQPILGYLDNYWKRGGERLRTYRDLSQHGAIVASEGEAFVAKDGNLAVRLFLPNNPECKSTARLEYDEPEIHVYPYMKRELCRIIAVAYEVTKALYRPGDEARQTSEVAFRRPLRFGPGIQVLGVRLVGPEGVDTVIEEVLKQLDSASWASPEETGKAEENGESESA